MSENESRSAVAQSIQRFPLFLSETRNKEVGNMDSSFDAGTNTLGEEKERDMKCLYLLNDQGWGWISFIFLLVLVLLDYFFVMLIPFIQKIYRPLLGYNYNLFSKKIYKLKS